MVDMADTETVTTSPHPLRARIINMGLTQEKVAAHLGVDVTLFSRYLRGIRPMPEGFAAKVHAKLDLLEAADQAAEEARARVLAEGEG